MSSEWKMISLGDCIELTTGFPFKSSEYSNDIDSVRLLRGDNIGQGTLRWDGVKKWPASKVAGLENYELMESDVVLAMDRPWIPVGLKFGRVTKEDLPALLVQRVARLRPTQRIYGDYLYSIIASRGFSEYIQNIATGTAVPHISATQIKSYSFQLPDIETQKRVGQLHASLDDRITLLRETNKTLESIAHAIFKSWFVDFDPVRAKMEGRQPEGMNEETAALFPDSFEDSELGSIPIGWQVMLIGDAVDTVGGATPDTKNPDFWDPPVHCWTTPKDLSGITAPILLDTERKLSPEGIKKVSSGLLPEGTLLLSSRAPIGYLALTQIPVAINQGYIAMLPGGVLPPLYLHFWCKQNMENIKGRANGSTFMEISKKAFRPIPILVPSPELIQRFANTANALFERLSENERQAQTLSAIRDTLLPRLISGQLRLPEAQEQIENALQ
ncbi:restriction endonuclease subunit S [Achromobacter marplatensis]|uniref:restriction endonuclease subunit S n=1 Tax=Achromobacter marplatensis TaxID=470868 RepID=UPI0028ECDD96|nr:restriction endonuclease subunit S [Achromobacter marplatensis]